MKKLILSKIVLLIILTISCESPTEVIDNTQPGRRDYVWTVDTLDAPGTVYFRMWGSSPSDLWAVSSSNWETEIAHYDGENWSVYGEKGIIAPLSIYGFSNENIFIGTLGGEVWQYDGSIWTQIFKLTNERGNNIAIDNMWGDSPNSVYATGVEYDSEKFINPVIAHYKNNDWKMFNTEVLVENGIVERIFKNDPDNKIYIQVVGGRNYRDSTFLYEYKDGGYDLLYSDEWTKGKQADLSLIDGEVYFIMGSRIAVRRNDKFYTLLNVDNPNFYQRIWGRNSKDLFLLMTDGLAHYNGSDTEYLFYFNRTPRTQIYGSALFEKDVYFLVDEAPSGLTLIYHGRLE